METASFPKRRDKFMSMILHDVLTQKYIKFVRGISFLYIPIQNIAYITSTRSSDWI